MLSHIRCQLKGSDVCAQYGCMRTNEKGVCARTCLCVRVDTHCARLVVARTRQRSLDGTENVPPPTCLIINMRGELVPELSDSYSFLWSVGALNSVCAFVALIQPLSYHLFQKHFE